MTNWKKNRGSGASQDEGMRGSSSSREDSMSGSSSQRGGGMTSGSREESMRGAGTTDSTGRGNTRGQTASTTSKGSFGSENLDEDDLSTTPRESTGLNQGGGLSASRQGGLGDRGGKLSSEGQLGDESLTGSDKGAMSGSSSGTTGLGNEKNRGTTGSPGGVEGVGRQTDSNPDEDKSRR